MSAEDSGNKEEDGGDGKLSVIVAIGGGGDFGPVARLLRKGRDSTKKVPSVGELCTRIFAHTSSRDLFDPNRTLKYIPLGILCTI